MSSKPLIAGSAPAPQVRVRARRALGVAFIGFALACFAIAVLAVCLLQWRGYLQLHPPGLGEPAFLGWVRGLLLGLAAGALKRISIIFCATGLISLSALLILRGPRREWERVLELILTQGATFKLMLLGSAIFVLAELSLPPVVKYLIDVVVNVLRDTRLLTWMLLAIVGILVLRAVGGRIRTYHAQALAFRIATDLRGKLYEHLQRLSYSFFDRSRQGELMSKVTNDVVTLQGFLYNSSEDFFVAPLKVLGGVACVFYLNWQMALVILVTSLLTALLLRFAGGALRRINRAVQEQVGELTAELAEGINTIRLAQSFGLEADELNRFQASNQRALDRVLESAKISALLLPVVEFLGFIAPVVIIGVMAYQAIFSGKPLAMGDFIAIAGYGAMVANPLGKLIRLLVTLAMGEAASQRIFSILETKPEIVDRPDARWPSPTPTAGCASTRSACATATNDPLVLDASRPRDRPGRGGGHRRRERHRQEQHDPPRAALLRRRRAGRVLLDGRDLRDITLSSLRQPDRHRQPGHDPGARHGAREHRLRHAGRRREGHRRRRGQRQRPQLHHGVPPGLRHAGRRARRDAFRRPAPAHRHRARAAARPADPAARRGDERAGQHQRGGGAGCAEQADVRAHDADGGAPAVHRAPCRPHRRAQARAHRRAGDARGADAAPGGEYARLVKLQGLD